MMMGLCMCVICSLVLLLCFRFHIIHVPLLLFFYHQKGNFISVFFVTFKIYAENCNNKNFDT